MSLEIGTGDYIATATITHEAVHRGDEMLIKYVLRKMEERYRAHTGEACDFVLVAVPVGKMISAQRRVNVAMNVNADFGTHD